MKDGTLSIDIDRLARGGRRVISHRGRAAASRSKAAACLQTSVTNTCHRPLARGARKYRGPHLADIVAGAPTDIPSRYTIGDPYAYEMLFLNCTRDPCVTFVRHEGPRSALRGPGARVAPSRSYPLAAR